MEKGIPDAPGVQPGYCKKDGPGTAFGWEIWSVWTCIQTASFLHIRTSRFPYSIYCMNSIFNSVLYAHI